MSSYTRRLGEPFAYEAELDSKQAELDAIEADLAATPKAGNDRTRPASPTAGWPVRRVA